MVAKVIRQTISPFLDLRFFRKLDPVSLAYSVNSWLVHLYNAWENSQLLHFHGSAGEEQFDLVAGNLQIWRRLKCCIIVTSILWTEKKIEDPCISRIYFQLTWVTNLTLVDRTGLWYRCLPNGLVQLQHTSATGIMLHPIFAVGANAVVGNVKKAAYWCCVRSMIGLHQSAKHCMHIKNTYSQEIIFR